MAKISKAELSKKKWKKRALESTYENKKRNQVIAYNKKIIKELRLTNKELLNLIDEQKSTRPVISQAQPYSRSLCVILNINANVSFRSIPKILKEFEYQKIPHFTSVINWNLRYGLGLLNQVSKSSRPWVAIIDHSIDFGHKNVLVVLRVHLDLIQENVALTLEDCECIGIKICEKVTGELVALDLEEIFKKSGPPALIIKDSDSALNKGCELWRIQSGATTPIVPDLGHVSGNSLKAEFNNSRRFKCFIRLTTLGANKLRQTLLAFALPPKLRNKGRFQSIGNLSLWAEKMLPLFMDKEKLKENEELKKIKHTFSGLVALRGFIMCFSITILATTRIMKMLKCEGLTKVNYLKSIEILNDLPEKSKVSIRLRKWLEQVHEIRNNLSLESIPVSSDIIESLFGRFKDINKRSATSEMNRSVLLIPTLCGVRNQEEISHAISMTTHKDLTDWDSKEVGETIRKKKMSFFKKIKSEKGEEKMVA